MKHMRNLGGDMKDRYPSGLLVMYVVYQPPSPVFL